MVKDKPWTLATLRAYGGTQGIGVAFLEEKLHGPSAHPTLRAYDRITNSNPRSDQSTWNEIDRKTAATVKLHHGEMGKHAAFVIELPLVEAEHVLASMSEAGYRPTSLRPFSTGEQSCVAVAWRRDGKPWHAKWDVTSKELLELNQVFATQRFEPVDISYRRATMDRASEALFSAVWVQSGSEAAERRLYVDETLSRHQRIAATMKNDEFRLERFFVRPAMSGEPLYSSIWQKSDGWYTSLDPIVSFAKDFENHYIGFFQSDCQFHTVDLSKKDLIEPHVDAARREKQFAASVDRDVELLGLVARYRLRLGSFDSAIPLFDKLVQVSNTIRRFTRHRRSPLARSRNSTATTNASPIASPALTGGDGRRSWPPLRNASSAGIGIFFIEPRLGRITNLFLDSRRHAG